MKSFKAVSGGGGVTAPLILYIYSCFEKGCPTKPYTTMPESIMGNGGSWSLIEALGVSVT